MRPLPFPAKLGQHRGRRQPGKLSQPAQAKQLQAPLSLTAHRQQRDGKTAQKHSLRAGRQDKDAVQADAQRGGFGAELVDRHADRRRQAQFANDGLALPLADRHGFGVAPFQTAQVEVESAGLCLLHRGHLAVQQLKQRGRCRPVQIETGRQKSCFRTEMLRPAQRHARLHALGQCLARAVQNSRRGASQTRIVHDNHRLSGQVRTLAPLHGYRKVGDNQVGDATGATRPGRGRR